MNVTAESKRLLELEHAAYQRGLERAITIADDMVDELWDDPAERSGACSVRQQLEEELKSTL